MSTYRSYRVLALVIVSIVCTAGIVAAGMQDPVQVPAAGLKKVEPVSCGGQDERPLLYCTVGTIKQVDRGDPDIIRGASPHDGRPFDQELVHEEYMVEDRRRRVAAQSVPVGLRAAGQRVHDLRGTSEAAERG